MTLYIGVDMHARQQSSQRGIRELGTSVSPLGNVMLMIPKAERKRCAWPGDLNLLITRSRSLVG